ncbi:MAG: YceH family protein [Acidobacteriota bacterium]|nr:YceH family protein [Acidobacteriota bacterium]
MTPLPNPLNAVQQRILGALLEKSQTTPDYYPLTVSALTAACNQKSGREPVMELSQDEVVDGLEALRRDVLVWRSEGARSERWSEGATRRLQLSDPSRAVLTLLLLRGPQTPGELRSRSERMHSFSSLEEVHETLDELASGIEPIVAEQPRQPGQKETRWAHLLGDLPLEETSPPHQAAPPGLPEPTMSGPDPAPGATLAPEASSGLAARVETLERLVQELRIEVAELRQAQRSTHS